MQIDFFWLCSYIEHQAIFFVEMIKKINTFFRFSVLKFHRKSLQQSQWVGRTKPSGKQTILSKLL